MFDEKKVCTLDTQAGSVPRTITEEPELKDRELTKIVNFNYLNVAFISYKLTMWDLMLFSGCHTRGQRLRKKDSSC